MVLDTIIHKMNSSHIFAHHSQKDCFHTYIYLITFKLCNILHTFYKRTITYISSTRGARSFWNRHSLMFPRFPRHKDWASNGVVHCASIALSAQNSEYDSSGQFLLLIKDSDDTSSFYKMLPVVQSFRPR
jgi:hypothetical protein